MAVVQWSCVWKIPNFINFCRQVVILLFVNELIHPKFYFVWKLSFILNYLLSSHHPNQSRLHTLPEKHSFFTFLLCWLLSLWTMFFKIVYATVHTATSTEPLGTCNSRLATKVGSRTQRLAIFASVVIARSLNMQLDLYQFRTVFVCITVSNWQLATLAFICMMEIIK